MARISPWVGWLTVCIIAGMPMMLHGQAKGSVEVRGMALPIKVKAVDQQTAFDVLLMAERGMEAILERMEGRLPKDVSIVIRWWPETTEDELAPPDMFPRLLRLKFNGVREFDIQCGGDLTRNRLAFYRSLVIVVLQALALEGRSWKEGDELCVPPFWLVEGLTQQFNSDEHEAMASIIGRYATQNKAPSLRTIQEWNELSGDALQRYWQQANAFWLVQHATDEAMERTSLQLWMRDFIHGRVNPYWEKNSASEGWWDTQMRKRPKTLLPILDWRSSRNQLQLLLTREVKLEDTSAETTIQLGALPSRVEWTPIFQRHIDTWLLDFANLEARTHFLWVPVTIQFRTALVHWREGDFGAYQRTFREAALQQESLEAFYSRAGKKLDWYAVNFPPQGVESDLGRYEQIFQHAHHPKTEANDPYRERFEQILRELEPSRSR